MKKRIFSPVGLAMLAAFLLSPALHGCISDATKALLHEGTLHADAGENQEAIECYTSVIERAPNWSPAYYNRGTVYMRLGEYNRAIADLTKAIELDPDYMEAYYNRGCVYIKQNDYGNARKDFKKACDLGAEKGCEAYDKLK
jgi:tetratricopeptide (TPR) repeat protein